MIAENMALISEINSLRKEIKELKAHKKQRDLNRFSTFSQAGKSATLPRPKSNRFPFDNRLFVLLRIGSNVQLSIHSFCCRSLCFSSHPTRVGAGSRTGSKQSSLTNAFVCTDLPFPVFSHLNLVHDTFYFSFDQAKILSLRTAIEQLHLQLHVATYTAN
jgi:hypothetical protein